jgi:hypothetical protein
VPHEQGPPVIAVAQRSAVHKCHALFQSGFAAGTGAEFRILHAHVEDIRHLAPIVVGVDTTRGHDGCGHAHIQHAIDAVVIVAHQVTRQARPVGPPFTPAEEVLFIERYLGRIPQELIPIDGLRTGFFVDVVLPGSAVVVPVGIRLDQVDVPQQAATYDILCRQETLCLPVLVADLEHSPGSTSCLAQRVGFGNIMGHRLFYVHVLIGPQSRNGHRGVPVVGRSDDYGIDIRTGWR